MSWLKIGNKLDCYPVPCKWLKFLLNIWWPLSCIICLFNIGEDVANWSYTVPALFILNIVMALAFFACGLFARFLDKTAMKAIYFLEGLVIVRSIFNLVYMILELGDLMTPVASDTENGIVNATVTLVDGFINAAAGLAMAFAIMAAIIQVLVAIITIMYTEKRKDLFLYSEKELKKLYEE